MNPNAHGAAPPFAGLLPTSSDSDTDSFGTQFSRQLGVPFGQRDSSSRGVGAYSRDTCEVCFGSSVRTIRYCPRCNSRACHACFRSWLQVRVDSGTVSNLSCIMCMEPVSNEEIALFCGERTLKKYLYFQSKFAHRSDPEAAWCPTEGCWRYLTDDFDGLPLKTQVTCKDCGTRVCGKCFSESHGNTACATPSMAWRQNALAHFWQKLHTKKCPVCSVRIQRVGGCSQMRCVSCQTRFCWKCRGVIVNPNVRDPRSTLHKCICPRVNYGFVWITMAGGIILLAPVALATVVVVGPPALVVYAVLPLRKKQKIQERIFAFCDSQ